MAKDTLGTYYYGHFVGASVGVRHRALTATVLNGIKVASGKKVMKNI